MIHITNIFFNVWFSFDCLFSLTSKCFQNSFLFIIAPLRLLTHVGFLRQNGLILSEVFLYTERSKNQEKKIHHNRAKKFHLPEEV